MANDLIKHLQVSTTTVFEQGGGTASQTSYAYYVLNHGPFVDKYKEGLDTPDVVNAGFQKRIDQLRAVGALPPGS
jgi:hypothetical protein